MTWYIEQHLLIRILVMCVRIEFHVLSFLQTTPDSQSMPSLESFSLILALEQSKFQDQKMSSFQLWWPVAAIFLHPGVCHDFQELVEVQHSLAMGTTTLVQIWPQVRLAEAVKQGCVTVCPHAACENKICKRKRRGLLTTVAPSLHRLGSFQIYRLSNPLICCRISEYLFRFLRAPEPEEDPSYIASVLGTYWF